MVHVCEFSQYHAPNGRWVADWSRTCPDYSDANAIMRVHRPRLQFSLRDVYGLPRLNEMNYKDMVNAIDPNFLKQGIRAAALRGVRYQQMDNDTMVFYVTSSEIDQNGIEYQNLVRFMNWDDLASDQDMTPRERALLLLWTSDIQVHCDDPSFLYWGYQYICSQLDASIYQETRPPHIRNPGMRGIVCKHLNRVLRALPFYNGDIAKVITQQWGGKLDQKAQQAIQQRESLQQQVDALPPEQAETVPAPVPFDMNQLPGVPPQQQEPGKEPAATSGMAPKPAEGPRGNEAPGNRRQPL